MAAYSRHVALVGPLGNLTPKLHVMWHMLLDTRFKGNPARYANWLDESLNKVLRGACRNASQATFEATVLLRMRGILRRGTKRVIADVS